MISSLFNHIFPFTCTICNSQECDQFDMCHRCLAYLHKTDKAQQHDLKHLDTLIAVYEYKTVAEISILKLKLSKLEFIANILAQTMADTVLRSKPTPDIITAVPMHYLDYCKRGFNQSASIAKILYHYMDKQFTEIQLHLLSKTTQTTKQGLLNSKERKINLNSVFKVNGNIKNKHIAVIDDVTTTGSTLEEIAKTLKTAGAKHVQGWAYCHA